MLACSARPSEAPRIAVAADGDAKSPAGLLRQVVDSQFARAAKRPVQRLATLPDDVDAVLVPVARLVEAIDARLHCSHAVGWRQNGFVELALLHEPESIAGLDGAIVAVASARSSALLTLITATASAGLDVVELRDTETVPARRTVGVIFTNNPEVGRFWLQSFRVDATPATPKTGAGARFRLAPRSRHVLCSRTERSWRAIATPDLVVAPIAPELRERLGTTKSTLSASPGRGGSVLVFGEQGSGPGQFGEPDAIAVDSRGRLLVGDEFFRKVHVFQADGRWVRSIGGPGKKVGRFGGAVAGIAVSKAGEIYCVDPGNSRVQVFDANYEPVRQFGRAGTGNGEFFSPAGIAIDTTGHIYVSDDGRNDVQVFTPAGEFVRKLGGSGRGRGQFFGVESLTVTRDGTLFVSDEGNGRVQVFDNAGRMLRMFGRGIFASEVEGLTVDAKGRIWALDEGAAKIRAFSPAGKYLGFLGAGIGSGTGELISPDGLAYHAALDRLYVVDELNHRVQAFAVSQMQPPEKNIKKAATLAARTHTFVLGRIGRPGQEVARYSLLAKQIAAELSTPKRTVVGQVKVFRSGREIVEALRNRSIDLVFESSLLSIFLQEKLGAVPLVAAAKNGAFTYRSIVFSRKDSGVKNLAQLEGQLIALEDSSSTSGFLVPSALLGKLGLGMVQRERGQTDGIAQRKVGYVLAYEEATIAAWVYAGRVKAGAFSELDFALLGAVREHFRVVAKSDVIAYFLVTAGSHISAETREKLRKVFLSMANTKAGRTALRPTMITRFSRLERKEIKQAIDRVRGYLPAVRPLLGL